MNIVTKTLTTLPEEVCNIIYEYYKLPFLAELKKCWKNKEEACYRLIRYHKVRHGRYQYWTEDGTPRFGSYLIHFPKRYMMLRGSNTYTNIFGTLKLGGHEGNELVYEPLTRSSRHRLGGIHDGIIEILMKDRAHDMRKKGSYWTIEELKVFCKMNKIKGYSKLNKQGLIRALMKV